MTRTSDPKEQRQLIVYPEGQITYDWEYEGFNVI
jgi:hypothetical protein